MAGQSEITFRLLDRTAAEEHADELQALHAEVYGRDDDGSFDDRFRIARRQPGFILAEARHGGYLVGYAFGMPLRPSTSWWRRLTSPLPDEVTTERPGRTFALVQLLVRPSWRRQGIGQALHDLILAGRPEERATLTVLPTATPAQRAFRKWGWRKVARANDGEPGSPVSDVLVLTLGQGRLRGGRHGAGRTVVLPVQSRGIGMARQLAAALLEQETVSGDHVRALVHAPNPAPVPAEPQAQSASFLD